MVGGASGRLWPAMRACTPAVCCRRGLAAAGSGLPHGPALQACMSSFRPSRHRDSVSVTPDREDRHPVRRLIRWTRPRGQGARGKRGKEKRQGGSGSAQDRPATNPQHGNAIEPPSKARHQWLRCDVNSAKPEKLVELSGIEPLTSSMPLKRSPS